MVHVGSNSNLLYNKVWNQPFPMQSRHQFSMHMTHQILLLDEHRLLYLFKSEKCRGLQIRDKDHGGIGSSPSHSIGAILWLLFIILFPI
jgi:hypothetical protein